MERLGIKRGMGILNSAEWFLLCLSSAIPPIPPYRSKEPVSSIPLTNGTVLGEQFFSKMPTDSVSVGHQGHEMRFFGKFWQTSAVHDKNTLKAMNFT